MPPRRKPATRRKKPSAKRPVRPRRKAPPRQRKKATAAVRRKRAARATTRRSRSSSSVRSSSTNKTGLSGPQRRTDAQHNAWMERSIRQRSAERERALDRAASEGRLLYPDAPKPNRSRAYDNIPYRISPPDGMPRRGTGVQKRKKRRI